MKSSSVRPLMFCAMLAALTAVCAWVTLPIGPVPISLSTFGVMMCGMLLGWKYGGIAVAVYILLGLAGAPVFTNFQAASALTGPTGGYIVGYLPYAVLAGLPVGRLQERFSGRCLLLILGTLICYLMGTGWFMLSTHRTLAESMTLCVLPFLPGDAAKIALCAFLALRLRRAIKM